MPEVDDRGLLCQLLDGPLIERDALLESLDRETRVQGGFGR